MEEAVERDMELQEHLDRLKFIAAAASRHIRLGTGVVSPPYPTPFMLTSCVRQLDHMRRGRAMFSVGPGALVHDAAKIGIKPPTSAAA